MSSGFIYLFSPAGEAASGEVPAAILRQGMGLRLFADSAKMALALGSQAVLAEPSLVLLCGGREQNLALAKHIRACAAHTPIVELLAPFDERAVLQGMSAGIDVCLPARVPVHMWLQSLQHLLAVQRRGEIHRLRAGSGGQAWAFRQRAWALESPQGTLVSLTAAERAVMLAMAQAPGKCISHAALSQVLGGTGKGAADKRGTRAGNKGGTLPTQGVGVRRLSVMMSRMRRKFQEAGVELPVRSLRGVGYELCVDITLAGELDTAPAPAVRQRKLAGLQPYCPGA